MSERRAPDRELLLATHQFPGAYTIKAFGACDEAFCDGVRHAVSAVVYERVEFSERRSSGGARVCVTAELHVIVVDEVLAVYESLYEVPGLRLIL